MKYKTILITSGIILTVIALLGIRVWMYYPREVAKLKYLESFVQRGSDYTITPKTSTSIEEIVNSKIFEGYTPKNHVDYEYNILENKPSNYVNEEDRHYYLEYIAKKGRMQFHSDFHEEEGISSWFEFIPHNLTVDHFFKHEISIHFNIRKNNYIIYILPDINNSHMAVYAKNENIKKIVWMD